MNQQMESHLDPVSELVLEWDERRSRGETITVDDLCRERPELIAEVTRRIRALEAVYRVPNRATPSETADADVSATLKIPGFTILGVLGRGGMGVVYKARHERLQRLCAVKMLRYEGAAGPMEKLRFRIEAESVAALQHAHIVQLYEVGEVGDTPYIVLEYVDGPNLAEQIRGKPVPAAESVELVEKLAQAVDYAHRRGIIHRDLKPSNILLSFSRERQASADTALVPKITDFGLAKRLRDTVTSTDGGPHTATGAVFGTPAYMAPEQALGRTHEVGPATDVYSLGAVLYESLTGCPPFRAANVLELLEQVRLHDPMPPRRLRADIPRDLEIICLKCLEKDPAKRYSSAGSLADDLRRFQNHEPIQARQAPWWEYTVKWARRRPAIAALLATVVGLLIIMAVGGISLAIIATRARDDAVASAEDEKKAKEAAQASQKETSAVLNFVEDKIFAAARPEGQEGGLGRNVLLRQAVEKALPFVEKSFTDEPLIEARLRMTLGISFAHLGEYETAADQFQKARILFTAQLGHEHPRTLPSINNLASCYDVLGRHADALLLHKETLELRKISLGPDHPHTLSSMVNLANSHTALGQFTDALALRESTLARLKAKLGPEHPNTLKGMMNVAMVYHALGRYADAQQLLEETRVLQKTNLGPDHPDTLKTIINLALCYANLGRDQDALQLRETSFALNEAKLGGNHPDTLTSMIHLANSYAAVARHDDALKLREKTLKMHVAKFGPDHPDTLICMHNVAQSCDALGRYTDALEIREKTLELRKIKLGPDHPDTLASMNNLAVSYATLDRHEEALALREETLARQKATLKADHPDTLNSMHNLAFSYASLGRHAEALELREETLARTKAKLGPDHPQTLRSMMGVALSYTSLDRHEEALKLHEETLALRKIKLAPNHPETLQNMYNVANCHADLNRHADALRLHEELLSLRNAKHGPDHPNTLKSLSGVAASLVELNRGAEAVPIIDECLQRAAEKVVDPKLIPGVMDLRLRHFVKSNDAAGCRETAEMWEKLSRTDAQSLYTAARMRAITAAVIEVGSDANATVLAKEQANLAIDWARKTLNADRKYVEKFADAIEFDSLRRRSDFQQILAEPQSHDRSP